jgi:hypothetical protein
MSNFENDYDNTETSIKLFLKKMECEILTESDIIVTNEDTQNRYKLFLYENWVYLLVIILFIIIVIKIIRYYIKKE